MAATKTVQAFIKAMRSFFPVDQDPTSVELAEILWLAQAMWRDSGSSKPRRREGTPAKAAGMAGPPPDRGDIEDAISALPETVEPAAGIYSSQTARGPGGRGELPIRAPSAPGLPARLRLGRALKPLTNCAPSRTSGVLDETATAEQYADSNIPVPVVVPERSRWLSVALLADRGGASRIWSRAIVDLKLVLERHPAFERVRAWDLDSSGEKVAIRPSGRGAGRSVSPGELLDGASHRLLLIASDCVSAVWSDGRMADLLSVWSRHASVAVLQLLPSELWDQSGLRFATPVRLRAATAAAVNASLIVERKSKLRPFRETGVVIPVTTLSTASIAKWARFAAAGGQASTRGFVLRREAREAPAPAPPLTAAARVSRFDSVASGEAQRLARLFAASPYPLTLPVMRLIQERLLPASELAVAAEVILGGLFAVHDSQNDDPDQWRYEFLDGVRDLLLDGANIVSSVRLIREVSAFMREHFGQTIDFAALIDDPANAGLLQLDANNVAFAHLGTAILRRLGGKYVDAARRIERDLSYAEQRSKLVIEPILPITQERPRALDSGKRSAFDPRQLLIERRATNHVHPPDPDDRPPSHLLTAPNLVKQYYERVVRYFVRRHQFTVEEARDLAQDVFVSVLRHIEQKPITAPWLFLKTAAHHRAVNEIRSRSIHRKAESGSADAIPHLTEMLLRDIWTDDMPPSPEELVGTNQQLAQLRDEIKNLPDTLRPPMLLWLEGLSYEEIAIALRLSAVGVRTRLRDAKKLLRSRLHPDVHDDQ